MFRFVKYIKYASDVVNSFHSGFAVQHGFIKYCDMPSD